MQTIIDIALAVGTVLSLVLHYFGKSNATAEKVAEDVDAVESVVKQVAPKA